MKEKLFHCQNDVIAQFTGETEDRFVWASTEEDAMDKLKNVLRMEQVEWVVDNFVPREVKDMDNKIIEREINEN